MLGGKEAEQLRPRRWSPVLALAMAGAATFGFWALPGRVGAVNARQAPCGGEALREDTFPAVAVAQASATAPAPSATFIPNAETFKKLQAQEGAIIQLSRFATNFYHATPSQAANIALTAKRLTGKVVAPGATFSYAGATGPFTAAGGYGWGRQFIGNRIVPSIGGGVCQGASTLYNAVLLANLQVVERHQHGLTVPYLPPGQDATVTDSGGLDFRFRNDTRWPVILWAQTQDRILTIAIFGRQAPPKVTLETTVLARFPFQTEYVRDPRLAAGEEQVAAPGQDGVRSVTYEVIQWPDGKTDRRLLSRDTYRASPRVILRGPTA